MDMLPEAIPAVFLPLIIFFARIVDVSLGTLRIIFVTKGMRARATFYAFLEILIWIIVIVQIFQNLGDWWNYVAYAAGFATGTSIGMMIEEKMELGLLIFRIITRKPSERLFEELKNAGFRATSVDGDGIYGPVKVIFTVAKRKRWKELSQLVTTHAPESFYSVEDVKYTSMMEQDMTPTPGVWARMLKLKKGL